jgi:hypothetical protein
MDYICPVCGSRLPRQIDIVMPHTEKHIVDEIKKKHPDWSADDGTCKKCYDFYKNQIHPK